MSIVRLCARAVAAPADTVIEARCYGTMCANDEATE